MTQMGIIRLALAFLGLLVLVLTFESIRRTALKERYALLWVIPCLILLGLTLFPQILDFLRIYMGLTYASSMGCVIFISLISAVFILSCSVSKTERDITKIATKCASLEARVKELEEREKR